MIAILLLAHVLTNEMSCMSCQFCEWDGAQNICAEHSDYDLLQMLFKQCDDYVYEPGTDEKETIGYEINDVFGECGLNFEKVEIAYK